MPVRFDYVMHAVDFKHLWTSHSGQVSTSLLISHTFFSLSFTFLQVTLVVYSVYHYDYSC